MKPADVDAALNGRENGWAPSWTWNGVVLLLAIGAFLRFHGLDRYPLPAHRDELSNAYDSWSLLETGADRTGNARPTVVRALGDSDYRPALYMWLTTIPMRIAGFSISAARITSTIAGMGSLLILFLLARRMAGTGYALIALTFATLSPWHITMSRLALEGATLPLFFLILALLLWHKAAAARYYPFAVMAAAGLTLGIAANTYHAPRLVAPVLVLFMAFDVLRHKPRPMATVAGLAAAALIGALPQIHFLLSDPAHFFGRASDVVIRANNPFQFAGIMLSNLAANFGPRYLFSPNMVNVGMTSVRLLPVEIVFLYAGLLTMWKMQFDEPREFRYWLYAVLLVCMIPATLTRDLSTMRTSISVIVLPLFSAAGVVMIGHGARQLGIGGKLYLAGAGAGIAASFAFVAYMYLYSATANGHQSSHALVRATQKVATYENRYERVFVENDTLIHSEIYVAAFTRMHPREFQLADKEIVQWKGWDNFRRLGKYRFPMGEEVSRLSVTPAVGPATELYVTRRPLAGARLLDSTAWNDDRYYISDNGPAR
ncbi:MAG: glycosyltransferase family 39 protein [Gemmatimonadaceae bacterium]